MANEFTSTISTDNGAPEVFGTKRVSWGTFVAGTAGGIGETAGDIDTGLLSCELMQLTYGESAGASQQTVSPSVAEVLPVAGNAVTVKVQLSSKGTWFALGQ